MGKRRLREAARAVTTAGDEIAPTISAVLGGVDPRRSCEVQNTSFFFDRRAGRRALVGGLLTRAAGSSLPHNPAVSGDGHRARTCSAIEASARVPFP